MPKNNDENSEQIDGKNGEKIDGENGENRW